MNTASSSSLFVQKYLKRLGLANNTLPPPPTVSTLCALTERHLERIPFENLAQHGVGEPVVLGDLDSAAATKILDHGRGGFCFELNPLFGKLLQELGFSVKLIGTNVVGSTNDAADDELLENHVILYVSIPNDNTIWFVDVGFGEPAIHPLKLEMNTVQTTPEGMSCRFVREKQNLIELQWQIKSGIDNSNALYEWKSRIQWNASNPERSFSLLEFQKGFESVHRPSSNFERKMIICRLTRHQKISLSGTTLKRTGPPRTFGADDIFDKNDSSVSQELESVDNVRNILEREFGIPYAETAGLVIRGKSNDD